MTKFIIKNKGKGVYDFSNPINANDVTKIHEENFWNLVGNDIKNNNSGDVFSTGKLNRDNIVFGKNNLQTDSSGGNFIDLRYNTIIGENILPITSTTGNTHFSVLMGRNIGSQNPTNIANSVVFGNEALRNLSVVSSQSVIIGDQAGLNIGYDDANVIIGRNTIGLGALNSSITNSVIIGNQAGLSLGTSSNNILIGKDSGLGITTGSNNTIIGTIAGSSNLTNTLILGTLVEKMRIDSVGNMGLGTQAPNSNAILDISSNSKGVLFPRMTTTQRNTIPLPPIGLTIYNIDRNEFEWFEGQVWLNRNLVKRINSSASTLVAGMIVTQSNTLGNGVTTTTVANSVQVAGVVIDGNLAVGGAVTVQVMGEVNVQVTGAVALGQFISTTTIAGVGVASTGTNVGTSFHAMQTKGVGVGLVKAMIVVGNKF